MQNPSRSVCIIENAIDRLIDYGDRRTLPPTGGWSICTPETVRNWGRFAMMGLRAGSQEILRQNFRFMLHTVGRMNWNAFVRADPATEQLLPDPSTFPSAERKVELAKQARAVTPLPPALVAPVNARGLKVSSEERRFASPLTTASIVSEKETVNQFFYTVTKGNRRCTIPGKMYSKRLPDSWVHINFVLFDEDGSELLNLNTDIMQEALRNTFVNGKPVTFVQ